MMYEVKFSLMSLCDAPLYQQIFSYPSLSVFSRRPAAALRPTYFGNLQATYNVADVPLNLGVRCIYTVS